LSAAKTWNESFRNPARKTSSKEAVMSKSTTSSACPGGREDDASSGRKPANGAAEEAAKQGGYDWASMLLPDNGAGDIRTTEVPPVPRVSRPSNTKFFRTDEELSGIVYMLDVDYDGDRSIYLVLPVVADQLKNETAIKRKRAVLCATRDKGLHVWPISADGTDTWTQSANQATELAKSQWVRVTSSLSLGEYQSVIAEGISEEPNWPNESFIDTLKRAFDGRVIDNLNHPVIRQLRGLE